MGITESQTHTPNASNRHRVGIGLYTWKRDKAELVRFDCKERGTRESKARDSEVRKGRGLVDSFWVRSFPLGSAGLQPS